MHQLREWCGDLWQWSRRQKALFIILTFVGVFVFLIARVNAQGVDFLDDPVTYIGGVIGSIIAWIIELLTKLIIIIVDILIQLASYNNFVHAAPVEVGWVLMRDVANMFFIVLLLVSAFATIIRYQPFHYKSVLPKLLLMAVLINFSKTLIGLLIDFSQVIMLTFVNAFRQAAAGNIVSALHLSQITQINSSADPSENITDKYSIASLIIAGILGIVMLSIALTVVTIMLIFIVARIVALWLLLILSPIAFFSTALPDKAAKALSAFTDGYWSRLSGVLVGGPVMAFFLWLTLAVVQGNPDEFKGMYTARGEAQAATSGDASASANFSTVVGNAGDIASFIIAIALLMSGVEFAVKSASVVGAGGIAGKLAAGGGVAAHLLRGATRITKKTAQVTGKVAGKAGGAAFEGVDRLTDIRGKIGRTGMKLSASMGGVGEEKFAAMAGYRGKRRKEAAEAMGKRMANMSVDQRIDYLERKKGALFSNQYEQAASTGALAGIASSGAGMKAMTAKAMAGLDEKKYKTPESRKAAAEAIALSKASDMLKSGMENAKAIGDDAQIDKYKKILEENPQFHTDWNELHDIKHADVGDKPKNYIKSIKPDSMKDSRTFLAHAHALGLVKSDGSFDESDTKKDIWDDLKRGNRGKYIEQHMAVLSNDPNKVKAQLDAIDSADEKVVAAANAARTYVSKEKGKFGIVGVQDAAGTSKPAEAVARAGVVRNEAAISAGKEKLREMGQRGNVKASDAEAVAVKAEMAAAGATLKEAFKFNAKGPEGVKGQFENKENALAFRKTMRDWTKGLEGGDPKSLENIKNLDTASMKEGGYNEARSIAIAELSSGALEKAMEEAVRTNDEAAQKQIGELVKMAEAEAYKAAEYVSRAGLTGEELKAATSMGTAGTAARQKMVNAGLGTESMVMNAAKAAVLYQQTRKSRTLRPMTSTTRDDVKQAVRGAASKVKETVATPDKMGRLARAAEPTIRAAGGAVARAARRATGGAGQGASASDAEKMEQKLMAEAERIAEENRNKPSKPEEPKDDAI